MCQTYETDTASQKKVLIHGPCQSYMCHMNNSVFLELCHFFKFIDTLNFLDTFIT